MGFRKARQLDPVHPHDARAVQFLVEGCDVVLSALGPTAVQNDVSLCERLGRHAVMLIDLGALDGAHGKAEMKASRKLVLEGLAHGAASDIHRPEDQTSIAAGMAWIRKQRGQHVLDQMLDENPRRVLTGELPDAPRA